MKQPKKQQIPVFRTIQFNSLRKKQSSQILLSHLGAQIIFKNDPNIIQIILGCVYILIAPQSYLLNVFSSLQYESIPKQFIIYQHQLTFNQILETAKNSMQKVEYLMDFINYYPISIYILQCLVRQKTKQYLKENSEDQIYLMGNQMAVLEDLSLHVRGPLLNMMVTSLKIMIKIIYETDKQGQQQLFQIYGQNSLLASLELRISKQQVKLINITTTKTQINCWQMQQQLKNSENNLKKQKMNMNIIESQKWRKASTDSSNVVRQPVKLYGAICDKCNQKSRFCKCSQRKKSVTPRFQQFTIPNQYKQMGYIPTQKIGGYQFNHKK